MADEIFLIHGDKLTELVDQHFETEAVFQSLLASHPGLLAGGQINAVVPRRWLLVRREMGIPGEQAGGDRWSLDHLFLDQDGVPTLVEVKRSTDTRLRRELVGQMLDYAAHAVHWRVEEIRSRFVARCEAEGLDPAEAIAAFLGEDSDAAAFWENVKTNLRAGRIRMLFVADVIPLELRQIVEFLNEQMDPAEVLALEIKQYVSGELRTLVPRIIGQTAEAESRKVSSRGPARVWDEATFFASAADKCDSAVISAMRRLYDWGRMRHGIVWGKGPEIGSFQIRHKRSGVNVLYVEDAGSVYPIFGGFKKLAPFHEDDRRRELLGKLNVIPGVKLPEKAIDQYWRAFSLQAISLPDGAQQVIEALSWALEEVDTATAAGERVRG